MNIITKSDACTACRDVNAGCHVGRVVAGRDGARAGLRAVRCGLHRRRHLGGPRQPGRHLRPRRRGAHRRSDCHHLLDLPVGWLHPRMPPPPRRLGRTGRLKVKRKMKDFTGKVLTAS